MDQDNYRLKQVAIVTGGGQKIGNFHGPAMSSIRQGGSAKSTKK
jgi:hypothetical protein